MLKIRRNRPRSSLGEVLIKCHSLRDMNTFGRMLERPCECVANTLEINEETVDSKVRWTTHGHAGVFYLLKRNFVKLVHTTQVDFVAKRLRGRLTFRLLEKNTERFSPKILLEKLPRPG